tara:strand:- start:63 stop:1133 length:1071 start_codon:yes stop_codon:yes gene_type:complete
MVKVLHIVGARPQFVKLSPLYNCMKKNNFKQKILHTGQHYDQNMSKIFFSKFNIPMPDFNLNINQLNHGAMTGRMIEMIEKILILEDLDYIIVYGDTNSTLAGSIASKKLRKKIIHVEAGVRNYDKFMPEEINRVLTDRISDLLFCSSLESYNNLVKEGYKKLDCKFHNVGDIMFENIIRADISKSILKNSNKILFTCHRQKNIEKNSLKNIIEAINELSTKYEIIFPAHPSTKKRLDEFNIRCNFKILNPISHDEILRLIMQSKYVITDSGGIVKEAYWLKKPSLSILKSPVWPELININASINSQPIKQMILESFNNLKKIKSFKEKIFGDGRSSQKMVNIILEDFNNTISHED